MWQFFVGAGVSLLAGQAAAGAASAAGRYNQAVADRNKALLDQQAEQAVFRTGQEIVRFRSQFQELQAASAAAMRFNGVVASSGTPLDVLLENAEQADAQIAAIQYNGAAEARDLRQEGINQQLQGSIAALEANAQASAIRASTVTSVFKGGIAAYDAGMFV